MIKAYYIVDSVKKVRLQGWHKSLDKAVERCNTLNKQNDTYNGKKCGRYFCGDWCDSKIAVELVNVPGEYPWGGAGD